MKRALLLFLLWTTGLGLAQNPVVISGTITDAGGNLASSGTVEFDVQPVSSSIHYYVPGVTAIAPQTVICNIQTNGTLLNTAGNGPCQVWGNDVLAPANSTYTVTFSPSGQETNAVPQECITGTSYNLTNPVFCPTVSVIPQYSSIVAPVIQGNLIPAYNGVFTIGNAQAYYSNIFVKNITFPSNTFAPGCLLTGGTTLSSTPCLVQNPTVNQLISQPTSTYFGVNNFEKTMYADQFSGADFVAKANAAANALPFGGIVDLTGFGVGSFDSTTLWTVTTNPAKPVTVRVAPGQTFKFGQQFSSTQINNAVTTGNSGSAGACIVPIAKGSAIINDAPNNGGTNFVLDNTAATYDFLCNAAMDGTQESLRISGLQVYGNSASPLKGSLLHLRRVFVGTIIDNNTFTNPYGNSFSMEGGSDVMLFNNTFQDSAGSGGYPGSVVHLTCSTNAQFEGGAIQFNGINNPLFVGEGANSTTTAFCDPGQANELAGVQFVGVDWEVTPATIGSFSGHATNVDPIQCTDCSSMLINQMLVSGPKGAGQNNFIDLFSSGSNGQQRGMIEFDNIKLDTSWVGVPFVNNQEPNVAPRLVSVTGEQNGCCWYFLGKYRWNGDANQTSSTDYEDNLSFTKVTSQIINGSQNPFLTSISAAITAAGSTGSVTIPPYYTALDTFSSNPNGVMIHDDRPLGSTNKAVQSVDAAQYGAICNGSNLDTAAIQNALNAQYAFSFSAGSTKVALDVTLPQGSCVVNTTLQMGPYGQIHGHGASTYVVADYSRWVGTNYTIFGIYATGSLIGGSAAVSRTIGDMNIIGINNTSIPSSTAFQVANFSNVYDACNTHCLANITFENMQIQSLDTAFDLQDTLNTNINNVFTSQVRNSWNLNGDVIQTFFSGDYAEVGSWAGTSTHSSTTGLLVTYNPKYSANCATHTQYCAPQGVFFHHSSIISFDNDVDIEQCTQCELDHNTLDLGAGGAGGSGSVITLGGYALGGGLWIDSNTLGTNKTTTYLLFSQAATSGTNVDGLWVTNNRFFDYVAPSSVVGIVFAGASPIYGVHVNGNHFSQLTEGVASQQNLLNSEFRGNSGQDISTNLINLVSSGTPDYTGTVLDGNTDTDSIPVIFDSGATNYVLGYNRSTTQLTGRFQAIGSGCSISAGAIGNNCSTTVGLPYTFPDTTYQVAGCTGQGTSHDVVFGSPTTLTTSGFTINEIAMTTSATSGGSVYCTVVHQ